MSYGASFVGGAMIGASALLLQARLGHVLGVSGILGGLVEGRGERSFRALFVGTLVVAGALVATLAPQMLGPSEAPLARIAGAGLLVGFGTRLGNGCTSGHGVCGVARLAPRSLLSTVVFVGVGMLTVFALRAAGVAS